MNRVMIIGQPGSGKSTLARLLGEKTNLPVVHIDKEVHWLPGWIERTPEEKTRLCRAIHARDQWIFEGGHSRTWPERLERCDTLIWLDFPLWIRLWRVVIRTIRDYGQSRIDLPEDCPEQFDMEFFRYIWHTRKHARRNCLELFSNAPPEKRRIRLRNRYEVNRFVESVADY